MSIREIEVRLSSARQRFQRAAKALAPKHKGSEREEFSAAHQAVLQLERELAAARNEEYAAPLEFCVRWDAGAPLPHLLRNDHSCFLIFYVREHNPGWDGTYVRVRDPESVEEQSLALVEFVGCVSARLGSPDDEVFQGHPLYGKGLETYTAQEVLNSRWLAELEAINHVHRSYNPERWRRLHHYVLWFHDTTFDCVAESFKVELYRESLADLLGRACKRLLS